MNSAPYSEQLKSVIGILTEVSTGLEQTQGAIGVRRMPRLVNGEVFDLAVVYISDGREAGKARDTWIQRLIKWMYMTNPWINCINTSFNWIELLPDDPKNLTTTPAFITSQPNRTWVLDSFDNFWHNPKPFKNAAGKMETPAKGSDRHLADLTRLLVKVKELGGFGIQFDDLNNKMTKADVAKVWALVEDSKTGLAVLGTALSSFPLTGWALHNEQYQLYTNEFTKDTPANRESLRKYYERSLNSYPATVTPNIGVYKEDGSAITAEWNLEYTINYILKTGVKGNGVRNISFYGYDDLTDLTKYPYHWALVCAGMNDFWLLHA